VTWVVVVYILLLPLVGWWAGCGGARRS